MVLLPPRPLSFKTDSLVNDKLVGQADLLMHERAAVLHRLHHCIVHLHWRISLKKSFSGTSERVPYLYKH